MRTVLQVPMTSSLKTNAYNAAKEMGFSSLQEVIRVILNKLASKNLTLNFEENIIPLSVKNEKRYSNIDKDFKQNKNTHTAKDINDLLKQLNAD